MNRKILIALGLAFGISSLAACNKEPKPNSPSPLDDRPALNRDATPPSSSTQAEELASGNDGSMSEDRSATPGSTEQKLSDGWITTKAKSALLTASTLEAGSIQVETAQGVVTLTGKVPSSADKEKASSVARSIEGVKRVENKLSIQP